MDENKLLGLIWLIVGGLYIWSIYLYDPSLAKYAAGGYIFGVIYALIRKKNL